jgi:CubicO group peptidase (beta-lactamase class C family)
VTPQTPFFSFSAGRVMTSLIAHLLVRISAVGYDAPVVSLWPEFGTHGKATATLRPHFNTAQRLADLTAAEINS